MRKRKNEKLGEYTMKHVVVVAHLQIPWFFWACDMPRQLSRLLLDWFPPLVQAPDTHFHSWMDWERGNTLYIHDFRDLKQLSTGCCLKCLLITIYEEEKSYVLTLTSGNDSTCSGASLTGLSTAMRTLALGLLNGLLSAKPFHVISCKKWEA